MIVDGTAKRHWHDTMDVYCCEFIRRFAHVVVRIAGNFVADDGR